MFYYVPFTKILTSIYEVEEIFTSEPGHVVGVIIRAAGNRTYPFYYQNSISIADTGATKNFIIQNTKFSVFRTLYTDAAAQVEQIFIQLDHTVEISHKIEIEFTIRNLENCTIDGLFIYEK
ncbi:TPA_asm: hypothetical protein [Altiarchaeum virus]|nr:TPA_asm: hypothetical protein [Altiarchaeum virus]